MCQWHDIYYFYLKQINILLLVNFVSFCVNCIYVLCVIYSKEHLWYSINHTDLNLFFASLYLGDLLK